VHQNVYLYFIPPLERARFVSVPPSVRLEVDPHHFCSSRFLKLALFSAYSPLRQLRQSLGHRSFSACLLMYFRPGLSNVNSSNLPSYSPLAFETNLLGGPFSPYYPRTIVLHYILGTVSFLYFTGPSFPHTFGVPFPSLPTQNLNSPSSHLSTGITR